MSNLNTIIRHEIIGSIFSTEEDSKVESNAKKHKILGDMKYGNKMWAGHSLVSTIMFTEKVHALFEKIQEDEKNGKKENPLEFIKTSMKSIVESFSKKSKGEHASIGSPVYVYKNTNAQVLIESENGEISKVQEDTINYLFNPVNFDNIINNFFNKIFDWNYPKNPDDQAKFTGFCYSVMRLKKGVIPDTLKKSNAKVSKEELVTLAIFVASAIVGFAAGSVVGNLVLRNWWMGNMLAIRSLNMNPNKILIHNEKRSYSIKFSVMGKQDMVIKFANGKYVSSELA